MNLAGKYGSLKSKYFETYLIMLEYNKAKL